MIKFNSIHNRNKSLNDKELNQVVYSPLKKIEKKRSWSSTNNLSNIEDMENSFFERDVFSPKKSVINRKTGKTPDYLSIDLENINDTIINSPVISPMVSIDENIEIQDECTEDNVDDVTGKKYKNIFNDPNLYIMNLMGYFYYLILSSISTIIINSVTNENIIFPIDSILFVYLSPIFYKLCFREIFFYSLKEEKKIIKYIYPVSIILGFCIRFLDYIPFFSKFILNTQSFINNPEYIALFCLLLFYMFGIFFNELYKSNYRKLNFCFLLAGGLFIFFTINYNLHNNYIIHAHHYFIGLLFHMVCQTKKSKISVINNAIGLGVFLEGISKWGFGSLYYRPYRIL
tara:strand:- start:29 stop:1060 length:1032 start_codon:yes stop_codon:yes gene_type:complete